MSHTILSGVASGVPTVAIPKTTAVLVSIDSQARRNPSTSHGRYP